MRLNLVFFSSLFFMARELLLVPLCMSMVITMCAVRFFLWGFFFHELLHFKLIFDLCRPIAKCFAARLDTQFDR